MALFDLLSFVYWCNTVAVLLSTSSMGENGPILKSRNNLGFRVGLKQPLTKGLKFGPSVRGRPQSKKFGPIFGA